MKADTDRNEFFSFGKIHQVLVSGGIAVVTHDLARPDCGWVKIKVSGKPIELIQIYHLPKTAGSLMMHTRCEVEPGDEPTEVDLGYMLPGSFIVLFKADKGINYFKDVVMHNIEIKLGENSFEYDLTPCKLSVAVEFPKGVDTKTAEIEVRAELPGVFSNYESWKTVPLENGKAQIELGN